MLVQHFLEQSAHCLPDKTALVCDDKSYTYRELNHAADRLASSLAELGIQRHDRVLIFLDNSTEAIIALFGILKAGATFVLPSPTMKARKLSYILNDSGARALITHTSKKGVVRQALSHVPNLRHLIVCPMLEEGMQDQFALLAENAMMHSWESLLDNPGSLSNRKLPRQIDIDLATIIYTSGSTGNPKGVMCAHYNIDAAAQSIIQYLQNVEDDIILSALPLSFDYGLYQILMAFRFSGSVVLERSFIYPYKILEKLSRTQATGFPLVPTMAALICQMDDLSQFDLSSLRYISNTAAALPISYINTLQSHFPHVSIYSMYGLTECKRVSYLPPEQLKSKPLSVGIPMPNVEVMVVDENGQEVPPNEIGELVIRGRNVMQGYWNLPGVTSETFRPGRYKGETLLYSGDYFRRDDQGFLFFVSRKDELIKTKGERVSPKEIEEVLCEMDEVAMATVIGIPD
ncbi:MAG: AMP-dependent synthetase, partial [Desulfobacteraceae bacterium]